ncbi:hypothetical protein [Fibrobacter sp. HC4]|uniref:hypothetical protein n=1 Tax=Fibrobacter sp. HC4 TaxID=3239812 RepID=UPI00201931A9|nr:hypothetical protein [Fibrobacter succinogenes]MCL4102160.1 hypothetical protein [Fibrobacter succinogenes]
MPLFRKTALEKISSPEQLDKMIVAISPSSWIAIVGGFVIVFCVALWSFLGTLPQSITAEGVFLDSDESTLVCFIPVNESYDIKAGQKAIISTQLQLLNGTVRQVKPYTASDEELVENLRKKVEGNSSTSVFAQVEIQTTEANKLKGTSARAEIITKEVAPIEFLISGAK